MCVRILLYILIVFLYFISHYHCLNSYQCQLINPTLHIRLVLSVDFCTIHDTRRTKTVSASSEALALVFCCVWIWLFWPTMMHISAVFKLCFLLCVISGMRREVDGNCAFLGYYAASSGNFLRTFLDNLSRAKNVLFVCWILNP